MEAVEAGSSVDQYVEEEQLRTYYLSGEPQISEEYSFNEFASPVSVKASGKAGRGLFLQKFAVRGQILLICNTESSCGSIRQCKVDGVDQDMELSILFSTSPSIRIPVEVHSHLVSELATRIDNCNVRERFQDYWDLDHGASGDMPISTPQIHAYKSSNANPESSRTVAAKDFDPERLWAIVAKNASCDKVISRTQMERGLRTLLVESCDYWGLWVLPSYINHSCAPNCNRMRVGNALIIRAATAIEAGAELTLPYFDIFQPLHAREVAAGLWDFRCECPRCIFERTLGEPFEDIQQQVMNLRQRVHMVWNQNETTPKRPFFPEVLRRLLAELKYQISRIGQAIKKRSLQLEEVASELEPRKALQPEPDLHKEQIRIRKESNWIKASFVQAYIAKYALLSKDPNVQTRTSTKAALGALLREVCESLEEILRNIDVVHPGNPMGLMFCSHLVKTTERLILEDATTCNEDNKARLDRNQLFAKRFYEVYHGNQTPDVLLSLIEKDSYLHSEWMNTYTAACL